MGNYWKRHAKRRRETPYMVAIHGPTRYVAVYNRHYELISEEPPAALVYRARRHYRQRWQGFNLTCRWQMPSWFNERMRSEIVTYHLYNDADVNNRKWLRAIPGVERAYNYG